MRNIEIEINGGPRCFLPGEEIWGIVSWESDKEPKKVSLKLFWSTAGKGTRDVGVVSEIDFEDPAARETRPFSFTLPSGPYSFSGKLISLLWALEATAKPGNLTSRVDFVLSPFGEEIVLIGNDAPFEESRPGESQ